MRFWQVRSKKEGTAFKIHRADFREGIVYNVANDYRWELRRRVLLAPPPPNPFKLTGAPFSEPRPAASPQKREAEKVDKAVIGAPAPRVGAGNHWEALAADAAAAALGVKSPPLAAAKATAASVAGMAAFAMEQLTGS